MVNRWVIHVLATWASIGNYFMRVAPVSLSEVFTKRG
jgi:hypothetical protein